MPHPGFILEGLESAGRFADQVLTATSHKYRSIKGAAEKAATAYIAANNGTYNALKSLGKRTVPQAITGGVTMPRRSRKVRKGKRRFARRVVKRGLRFSKPISQYHENKVTYSKKAVSRRTIGRQRAHINRFMRDLVSLKMPYIFRRTTSVQSSPAADAQAWVMCGSLYSLYGTTNQNDLWYLSQYMNQQSAAPFGSSLSGTSTFQGLSKFLCCSAKMQVTAQVSVGNAYIDCYECVARSETDAIVDMTNDIANNPVSVTAGSIMNTTNVGVTLFNLHDFCSQWLILKKTSHYIMNGTSVTFELIDKKKWEFSPEQLPQAALGGTISKLGGRTKTLFFCVKGDVEPNAGAPRVATTTVNFYGNREYLCKPMGMDPVVNTNI